MKKNSPRRDLSPYRNKASLSNKRIFHPFCRENWKRLIAAGTNTAGLFAPAALPARHLAMHKPRQTRVPLLLMPPTDFSASFEANNQVAR
jgi:hypothetical protein